MTIDVTTFSTHYMKRMVMLLLVVLCVSACGNRDECIAADDFGDPKITVDAYGKVDVIHHETHPNEYPPKGINAGNRDGSIRSFFSCDPDNPPPDTQHCDTDHPNIPQLPKAFNDRQVSAWVDTGLYLNGKALRIDWGRNTGEWTAWWGRHKMEASRKAPKDKLCNPTGLNPKSTDCSAATMCQAGATEASIANAPCWFNRGCALYGLFAEKGYDPNAYKNADGTIDVNRSIVRMRNTDSAVIMPTAHLAANFEGESERVAQYHGDIPSGAQAGDKVYLKILDQYYEDNAGSYHVRFQQGVRGDQDGIIATIIRFVREPLEGASQKIYHAVVQSDQFIQYVSLALTLYIMFYGLYFMAGLTQNSWGDVLVRIIKVAIVVQLIQPDSWEFFDTYLFGVFANFMDTMVATLMNIPLDQAEGGYTTQGFVELENMLAKFFSQEANYKITSLLFYEFPPGVALLYVPAIYVALILFALAVFNAVLVYLFTLIGTAIMIIIFPVFFVMMLFEFTKKHLWFEWLRYMVMMVFIVMMLFAALGVFSTIILDQFYRMLGFTICWDQFWRFEIAGTEFWTFYWWKPNIQDIYEWMWVDVWDENRYIYTEQYAQRYIDMPYLNPDDPEDMERIRRGLSGGTLMDFIDILYFGIIIYLLYIFCKKDNGGIVETIAKELVRIGGGSVAAIRVGFTSLARGAAESGTAFSPIPSLVKTADGRTKESRSALVLAEQTAERAVAAPATLAELGLNKATKLPAKAFKKKKKKKK